MAHTIKQSLGDESLTSLFQQLLGSDRPDAEVVRPKYTRLAILIKSIANIFQSFHDDVFSITYPDMESQSNSIIKFTERLNALKLTVPDKDDELVDGYVTLKKCEEVSMLLEICKTLIQNKSSIENGESDIGWVNRLPGLTFYPFPFSTINLKSIWVDDRTTTQIKKYIVMVCKVLLKKTHSIYEDITSADIDVSKFSELIMSAIAQVKKQIPRCESAFSKIEDSIGLLNKNFTGYYKDFVQTQNPASIMESFVFDVANNNNVDVKTTFQFRKIIAYYQKKTNGTIKDPRIKKVFDLLSSNLGILENGHADEIKRMEEEYANTEEVEEKQPTKTQKKNAKNRQKKKKQATVE